MLLSVPQKFVPALEVVLPLRASSLTSPTLAPLTGAVVPPALWLRQREQKPKPKKKGYRRVSRAAETSPVVVSRAIPKGLRRATHTDEVLAALEDDPEFQSRRADFRRNVKRCLMEMIDCVDFATMTTRPGWRHLGAVVSVKKRSVGRHLQELEVMGLVAVVAGGRQAQ